MSKSRRYERGATFGMSLGEEICKFTSRTSDSVQKLRNGEISESQFAGELIINAGRGLVTSTATLAGAIVGETLIRIPAVGALAGTYFVDYILEKMGI